jgi:hypothetical protein
MRPDWDADSHELRRNLTRVLQTAEGESHARAPLNLNTARRWQREVMQDLAVLNPAYVGAFRGEPGLEKCQVHSADGGAYPPPKWRMPYSNSSNDCSRLSHYWIRSFRRTHSLTQIRPMPLSNYVRGCMPNGYAFTPLPMEMAAQHASGSTALRCAMAYLLFYGCGLGRTVAMPRPAHRPCWEIGRQRLTACGSC